MKTDLISPPSLSLRLVLAAVLLTSATQHRTMAANQTWTGGGANANFATAGNWSGGAVPGAAFTATFNNAVRTTITVTANRANGSFLFSGASAGAFTFNAGSFTVANAGSITINSGVTNTQTFNSSLLLPTIANSTYSFINNSSTTSAKLNIAGAVTGRTAATPSTLTLAGSNGGTISGVIGNGGNGGSVALTKSGAGTWVMTGVNTYTGATAVNAGTLEIGGSGRLAGTTPVTVGPAGTLMLSTSASTAVTGGLTLSGGNLRFGANTVNLPSTTLNPATTSVIDTNGSNATFSTVIGGAGGFNKIGAGDLNFTAANTYSGNTTVSGGKLLANNTTGSALGSGNVTVDSTATLGGSGSVSLAAGKIVTLNGTLSIGNTGDTTGADLAISTLGGGSTIFGSSAIVTMDIFSGAGHGAIVNNAEADVLRLFGNLDITSGANLVLGNPNAIASASWGDGDTFQLIDWTGIGSRTGTFAAVDASALSLPIGWSVDSSQLYNSGVIRIVNGIVSIPEPSRLVLVVLGFTLLASRRSRK